jgi:hypothetical protein
MNFDTVWQDKEDAARLHRSLPLVTTDCARLCLQERLVELEGRILADNRARESRASVMASRRRRSAPRPSSPAPGLLLLDRQLDQSPQQGHAIAGVGGNRI